MTKKAKALTKAERAAAADRVGEQCAEIFRKGRGVLAYWNPDVGAVQVAGYPEILVGAIDAGLVALSQRGHGRIEVEWDGRAWTVNAYGGKRARPR